ncbi:MAG TPA: ATP-binding cassette domain-containing protein [Saprospiraceae bacterium]|nr:ATP-binding cassette domain-containing protein [Saprospiraceae bacterium]
MLQIHDISKRFSQGTGEQITALDNFSLEVPEGSFITIIGGNGSGKSTLLNCIAGSIFQDSGTIWLAGSKIDHLPDYKRAVFISRIFQNPLAGTAPDMSIVENFRIASLRKKRRRMSLGIGKNFRNEVAERLSPLGLGLENKLDQPVGQLSGGQRQALSLLMAIFDPPSLLLLDEPTAALDPKSSRLVLQLADRLIHEYGLTCLFITHNMADAIHYGDRLLQIHRGKLKRDIRGKEKYDYTPIDLMGWFLED